MKNFKLIMIVMMFTCTLVSVNAQRRVVEVYPSQGTVVTTIHKPKIIIHKGTRFHFAKGVWYKAKGKKFVVSGAPIGVVIKRLPRDYKVVRHNGRKIYQYKGIRYQKKRGGYIIVNV